MDITYSSVTETLRSKLLSACVNVDSKYDSSVPTVFKPGYRSEQTKTPHSWTPYHPWYWYEYNIPYSRCIVIRQGVERASSSDFNTMFNYFVKATGIELSSYCTMNGMYYLLSNLVAFGTSCLYYSTSMLDSSKLIIFKKPVYYGTSNNVLTSESAIVNAMKSQIVKNIHQSDIVDNYVRHDVLVESLEKYISSMKQKLRIIPVIYGYELTFV